MRIALLHYSAPPVIGGVEGILGAHARLLRSAGHQVLVVAGRGDAEIVPELDSRHPEVEKVTAALAEGRIAKGYADLRAGLAERLAEVLAGTEVVVAHNVMTMPFNLPAAEALISLRKRLVAWTHDIAWTMPRYAGFRRDRPPWSLLGQAQPGCLYVAVSRTRAREAEAALGVRPEVVVNGVDTLPFIGVSPAGAALASRAGLLDADPLILVPTRITPRKRIEVAIETAAALRSTHPNLRLVVSGPLGAHSPENAAYAASLEALALDRGCIENVIFMRSLSKSEKVHAVNDDQMADLYRLADVVLLPSSTEGFGLVLLESGLARAPVVCPDLSVLREVGGGGTLRFRPGAPAAELVALCRRALATRSARLRRRARAQDWRHVLPRLERVLVEASRG